MEAASLGASAPAPQWWPSSGGSDACHFLARFWWLGKFPCKFDFVTSRRAGINDVIILYMQQWQNSRRGKVSNTAFKFPSDQSRRQRIWINGQPHRQLLSTVKNKLYWVCSKQTTPSSKWGCQMLCIHLQSRQEGAFSEFSWRGKPYLQIPEQEIVSQTVPFAMRGRVWSCCKLCFVIMANRGKIPITNEICTLHPSSNYITLWMLASYCLLSTQQQFVSCSVTRPYSLCEELALHPGKPHPSPASYLSSFLSPALGK